MFAALGCFGVVVGIMGVERQLFTALSVTTTPLCESDREGDVTKKREKKNLWRLGAWEWERFVRGFYWMAEKALVLKSTNGKSRKVLNSTVTVTLVRVTEYCRGIVFSVV